MLLHRVGRGPPADAVGRQQAVDPERTSADRSGRRGALRRERPRDARHHARAEDRRGAGRPGSDRTRASRTRGICSVESEEPMSNSSVTRLFNAPGHARRHRLSADVLFAGRRREITRGRRAHANGKSTVEAARGQARRKGQRSPSPERGPAAGRGFLPISTTGLTARMRRQTPINLFRVSACQRTRVPPRPPPSRRRPSCRQSKRFRHAAGCTVAAAIDSTSWKSLVRRGRLRRWRVDGARPVDLFPAASLDR